MQLIHSVFMNDKSNKRTFISIDSTITKVEHLIDEINQLENVPLSKDEVTKELKSDLAGVKNLWIVGRKYAR